MSIARSRSIDRLRARMGRGATKEELLELVGPVPAPDEDPATLSEAARARRALSTLSDEERQALLLAYFGGWRHAEIAITLGVPVAAAKGHIAGGLRALMSAFDKSGAGA
jgi:RNA polymerase sigma-70 factor (ECF subfamily)